MDDSFLSFEKIKEESLKQLLTEQNKRDPIFTINNYKFYIDDFAEHSIEQITREVIMLKKGYSLDYYINNNILDYILKQIDGLTN